MTDEYWYPLYKKMTELDVPAIIHISSSCNPAAHTLGGHYLLVTWNQVGEMRGPDRQQLRPTDLDPATTESGHIDPDFADVGQD